MLKNIIALLLINIMLTACSPMYKTSYSFEPPVKEQGKMCVMQCAQSKSLCKQLCRSDINVCEADARERARFNFDNYASKRKANNLPVDRDLNSFYSAIQCAQRTCTCDDDYRACFEMCGGKISPYRQCVAFCDKT